MLEWGLLDEERTPFWYSFSKHGFCLRSRLSAAWCNVECFCLCPGILMSNFDRFEHLRQRGWPGVTPAAILTDHTAGAP
jgi:hypothetical protein